MNTKKCLGVMTARGGSKGVPNKNIRPVCGKPLMEYAYQFAKASPYINDVILTTDSPEIRDAGLKIGMEAPFLRPAEFATDTAKQEDAILHLMDWCESQGRKYDYLCLLTPSTPLGRTETLNKAFELLYSRNDAEGIFSVSETEFSPLRCNTLRPDGLMKDWQDKRFIWMNRQEMPRFYRLCGLITISKWDAFRREKTFLQDKTLSFPVDAVESWDINTPFEFFVVEKLLEKGFHHSSQIADMLKKELQNSNKP